MPSELPAWIGHPYETVPEGIIVLFRINLRLFLLRTFLVKIRVPSQIGDFKWKIEGGRLGPYPCVELFTCINRI